MSISAADNELLCRVDGTAPMGAFLRESYWMPAVVARTLEAGGRPKRVKLVGRNYVVFRDTEGKPGCLDEACPHKGVSLALGRNEPGGLRCLLHGWKFQPDGTCIETPAQYLNPEKFCASVRNIGHPAREAGGIIWVWLGAGEPKAFPSFEWTDLPEDQCFPARQDVPYNWIQGIEANIDSSHVGHLHKSFMANLGVLARAAEATPRYEITDSPLGFLAAAIRDYEEGVSYVRTSQFVAPIFTFLAAEVPENGDRNCIFYVPQDDTHSTHWFVRYNVEKPVDQQLMKKILGPGAINTPDAWPPANPGAEALWGQDPALVQMGLTGYRAVHMEDTAAIASMGAFMDHSQEYLSDSDAACVRYRRMMLRAVREFEKGTTPKIAQFDGVDFSSFHGRGYTIDTKKADDVAFASLKENA